MQEACSADVDASALAPLQAAFDERICSHKVHLAAAAATGTLAAVTTLAGEARRLGLNTAVDAAHATVVTRIAAARPQVLTALEALLAAREGVACTSVCPQGGSFGADKPVGPTDCEPCSIEELLAAEAAALFELGMRPCRDNLTLPVSPEAANTVGILHGSDAATLASPVLTRAAATLEEQPLGRVLAAAHEAARLGLCPLATVALESVLMFARWHLAAAFRTSFCAVVCRNYSGTVLAVGPSGLVPLATPLSHSPLVTSDPLLSHFSQWQSAAPSVALPAWTLIAPPTPRHAAQLAAMLTLQKSTAAQVTMEKSITSTCASPGRRTAAEAMHAESGESAPASASGHATGHSGLAESSGDDAKSGGTIDGTVLTPAMLHACMGAFTHVNTAPVPARPVYHL